MPEKFPIEDSLLGNAQSPQGTLQYPQVPAHLVGADGIVAQQGMYDPGVCPHDTTITTADVQKGYVNPNEPPYFILNCTVICAHCHTPFEFVHPVRGKRTDQASISQDSRTLHGVMLPRPRRVPPV